MNRSSQNAKPQETNSFIDRFDNAFYDTIPNEPGVYLVLNDAAVVIFIGKSKDLQKRIKSYRYLSPERTNDNAWHIATEAAEIQWEVCRDAKQATLRANYLTRRYRPRYNSYSSSTDSYRFIGFQLSDRTLHFVTGNDIRLSTDFHLYGAFKHFGQFNRAFSALLRLTWATNKDATQLERIPLLLLKRQPPDSYKITLNSNWNNKDKERWEYLLKRFLKGTAKALLNEMQLNINQKFTSSDSFLERLFKNDFDELSQFFEAGPKLNYTIYQQHHLKSVLIPSEDLDDLLTSLNESI